MSTTVSPINPERFVIPHTVAPGSPSQTAFQMGAARNAYQHDLAQVGKGKVGGGLKHKKNKKSKKYRKSKMKKRFSKKFRKSIMRKRQSKARKLSFRIKNNKALHGGAATISPSTLTIPSFSQTSVVGTNIINQLAINHAKTVSYSQYDNQVGKAS
jgi:hypothetical protein